MDRVVCTTVQALAETHKAEVSCMPQNLLTLRAHTARAKNVQRGARAKTHMALGAQQLLYPLVHLVIAL